MKPILAVAAPGEFALDRVSGDYGVDEVSPVNVADDALPRNAAGLLIYAGDGSLFDRDATEPLREAIDAGIPVLASSGGMHELNVALGGDVAKEVLEHGASADGAINRKSVFLAPGAKVSSTIGGSGWLGFPCNHQKGISQGGLAPGLMASAMADDRIVEAFEMPGHRWVIGVQWDVFSAKRLPRGFDGIWLAFLERVTGA